MRKCYFIGECRLWHFPFFKGENSQKRYRRLHKVEAPVAPSVLDSGIAILL